MKKIIVLLLAAVMLIPLAACGAETEKEPVTIGKIDQAIQDALGDGYLCTVDVPEEELYLSPAGYLDMEKVSGYVAKQAEVSAVDLDTLVIVQCKDGYADEAVKLLNESYAQTLSYVNQYSFGVAKVQGARLYKFESDTVEDIVVFVIAGAKPDGEATAEEEAELANAEYAKIDSALKNLCGYLPKNLAEN